MGSPEPILKSPSLSAPKFSREKKKIMSKSFSMVAAVLFIASCVTQTHGMFTTFFGKTKAEHYKHAEFNPTRMTKGAKKCAIETCRQNFRLHRRSRCRKCGDEVCYFKCTNTLPIDGITDKNGILTNETIWCTRCLKKEDSLYKGDNPSRLTFKTIRKKNKFFKI